jgi:hypothetical protein
MEELLFSLVVLLCERFPALTPFSVSRESFHDVIALFEDLKQNNTGKGEDELPAGSFELNGTVYVPAQNDDWY